MTTFPLLRPATAPFSGGQYRSVEHQAMGGGTTTVLLDMVERGRKWTPTFSPISQADWEQILDHFREHGIHEGFEFDVTTLPAQWTPTGCWWRWVRQPQASDPHTGMRSVDCEFELVPIVHRRFGGERLTVAVELVPGDQPDPPEPVPSLVFGGERLTVVVQLETGSTRNQPGTALATVTAASGGTVEGVFVLPGVFVQLRGWSSSESGWLRLYASEAAMAADATRPRSQAPDSAAGIIIDPALEAAGHMDFMPLEVGVNLESPRSNFYPFRFTNLGDAGEVRLVMYYEPSRSTWS